MHALRWLVVVPAVAFLSACAFAHPPYVADASAIEQLGRMPLQRVAVARFEPTDAANPGPRVARQDLSRR
jgi:hypothetical protein